MGTNDAVNDPEPVVISGPSQDVAGPNADTVDTPPEMADAPANDETMTPPHGDKLGKNAV